jgi:hypothetical protein
MSLKDSSFINLSFVEKHLLVLFYIYIPTICELQLSIVAITWSVSCAENLICYGYMASVMNKWLWIKQRIILTGKIKVTEPLQTCFNLKYKDLWLSPRIRGDMLAFAVTDWWINSWAMTRLVSIFRQDGKIAKRDNQLRQISSIRPSVFLNGTTRLPRDKFSWHFTFGIMPKIHVWKPE